MKTMNKKIERTRAKWSGRSEHSCVCDARLQEVSSVSKNVGMKMKQVLKPKAVFSEALPNCSPPPAKRRRTAFEKSERSSVSFFRYLCIVDKIITTCICIYILMLMLLVIVNEPSADLCEATTTAQVIAMLVAPELCLKN